MAPLIQAFDGGFYGTTSIGGGVVGNQQGTVFQLTGGGPISVLHTFTSLAGDGSTPQAPLIQGADGDFYGTTRQGGTHNFGMIFKVTAAGGFIPLWSFKGNQFSEGALPVAGLMIARDGKFYGTTASGGETTGSNYGTVFRMDTDGTEGGTDVEVLHYFTPSDGVEPQAALIQGPDGDDTLYGTTSADGALPGWTGGGTLFTLTLSGGFTRLRTFDSRDGGTHPIAALLYGTDGNFYGTTNFDGPFHYGTVFQMTTDGTPEGTIVTTLHAFQQSEQGPAAPLIQDTMGNLYGTTYGGNGYSGIAFQIAGDDQSFSVLHVFGGVLPDGTRDGIYPAAPLIQASDTCFYGTTRYGGPQGGGTVFRMITAGSHLAMGVSASSLEFGDQVVGTRSSPQTVVVTNSGCGELSIQAQLVFDGADDFDQSNNCPVSLHTGASCAIDVTFTPSIVSAEDARLVVFDSGSNVSQSVLLTGNGVPGGAAPR